MFLEILLAILIGIAVGIITGLTPGVHVNLVTALLLSSAPLLLGYASSLSLIIFIIALALTHTFLDAIPSIFLGAPDADQALSVLPGHRMLLQGKGLEAIQLTVEGSLFTMIVTIAFIPLMIPFLPALYSFIEPVMAWILIAAAVYVIVTEESINQKIAAGMIFLVSGILGVIVLSMHTLSQPLLGMLSGLFGISTLLISLNDNNNVPVQAQCSDTVVEKIEGVKTVSAAVLSGSLTGIFPGLSSAHAAMIGMQLVGKVSVQGFLMLIGGINTVNFLFSLATYFALQKARNGAIIAVAALQDTFSVNLLIIMLLAALITGCIATVLAMKISRVFARILNVCNYQVIAVSIIMLIIFLVTVFDGLVGLILLITATAIGMLPACFRTKRSIAMGCLLLPVILWFL